MAHLHRPHRVTRRGFLTDLGKGTIAVTVMGAAFVACGDDDGPSSADGTSTTAASDPSSTTPSSGPSEGPTPLRFERASFGFVSAYVLLRGNEAVVVDTGNGDIAPISEALTAAGSGFDQVGDIILTHLHGDHVGGLDALVDAAPSARAHAGEADISGIATSATLNPLADGDEVFGLRIIATPGHTAGHVSVFDPDTGILVAGDALNLSTGELTGSAPEFTADAAAADSSVDTLAALAVQSILPGHGDPLTTDAGSALTALAGA